MKKQFSGYGPVNGSAQEKPDPGGPRRAIDGYLFLFMPRRCSSPGGFNHYRGLTSQTRCKQWRLRPMMSRPRRTSMTKLPELPEAEASLVRSASHA